MTMWLRRNDNNQAFPVEQKGHGITSTLIGTPSRESAPSALPSTSEDGLSIKKLLSFARSKDDKNDEKAVEKALEHAEQVDMKKRKEEVLNLNDEIANLQDKINDINSGAYLPTDLEKESSKDDRVALPLDLENTETPAEKNMEKFANTVDAERRIADNVQEKVDNQLAETKTAEEEVKALIKTSVKPEVKRELSDYEKQLKTEQKKLETEKKDIKSVEKDIKTKENVAKELDRENQFLAESGFY